MRNVATAAVIFLATAFLYFSPSFVGVQAAKADACCQGPAGRSAYIGSNRACRAAGGVVVNDRECRRRTCCMGPAGRSGWFDNPRACSYAGGRVVGNRECRLDSDWGGRGDGDNLCCKRGAREWWTTWQECRRAAGGVVANRFCRR